MYTIGQVAEMFGLPVSTLRYYDKQGLFPGLEWASGIRRFGDTELEALRVIEYLKKAGMWWFGVARSALWYPRCASWLRILSLRMSKRRHGHLFRTRDVTSLQVRRRHDVIRPGFRW